MRRRAERVVPVWVAVASGARTLADLTAVLGELGIPGRAVDTADLGRSGWLLAQVLATGEGEVLGWSPEQRGLHPVLSQGALARHLEEHFDTVTVDEEVELAEHLLVPEAEPVVGEHRGAVLVRSAGRGGDDRITAGVHGATYRTWDHGEHTLVWRVDGEGEDPVDDLVAMNHGRRAAGLVLWRHGATIGAIDLEGEKARHRWLWQPGWQTITLGGPEDAERDQVARLVAGDLGGEPAPTAFAAWGQDAVRRRAALRRATDHPEELVAALGLPAETLALLDGEEPAEVSTVEPQGLRESLRAEMDALAAEPGLFGRMERAARAVSPGYLVYNLLCLLIGVGATWLHAEGQLPRWVLVVAWVLVGPQLVDLAVRVRNRRRRETRTRSRSA